MLEIPRPTREFVDGPEDFAPSPELEDWARRAFIEDGPLHNPDHQHLGGAQIGVLLTNVPNSRQGRRVLGTAQLGLPTGKPWPRAERLVQIEGWFGHVPDFIVTLDACFLLDCEPLAVCALMEHELYHCGQELDRWGSPRYDRDGAPIFAIRPHDVEEFTGVARRYGAWKEDLAALADALAAPPQFGAVRLDGICGCGGAVVA